MRFVDKSKFSNVAERQIGLSEAKSKIEEYLQLKPSVRRRRRPPVDYRVFLELLPILHKAFSMRCAYCESKVSIETADIEHFRPLSNALDSDNTSSLEHYVWLAYEWDNLLLSCATCNSLKRNQFPLLGSRAPLDSTPSVDDLREMERCLLLDPCYDFGSKYLTFLRNGKIIPREDLSKTDKRIADTHLRIMQLNRQFLVTERRTSFDKTVSRLKSGALSLKNTISTNAEKISFNQIDSTVHWETFIFDGSVDYPGAISKIALNMVHKASPNFKGNLREALSIFENSISDNFRDDPLGEELEYKEIADASIVKITTQFDSINLDTLNAPLQSVTIKNFKAIRSIELALSHRAPLEAPHHIHPSMIILGENGTGKSTVLEAITLGLLGTDTIQALNRKLNTQRIEPSKWVHQEEYGMSSKGRLDDVTELKVKVEFGVNQRGLDDDNSSTEILANRNDHTFYGNHEQAKIVLAYGARRYFDHRKTNRYKAKEFRVLSLFDPISTLPNPIPWLMRQDRDGKLDPVVRALRPMLLLSDEDEIYYEDDDLFVKVNHVVTPFEYMSVGYKSVIAMSVDIFRELLDYYDNLEEASAVILIDEIETHLHPKWKMKIMPALRQALPKVQFIVTTHDPLCLRGMEQGEVFVLKRSYEKTTQSHSGDPEIHSMELRPGMDTDDVLTSAGFGLSTTYLDETTEDRISEYAKLLLSTDRNKFEDKESSQSDKSRLSYLRNELSKSITGFSATPIDTVDDIQSKQAEVVPSNFEAALKKALNSRED